jgi:hypothetical protein
MRKKCTAAAAAGHLGLPDEKMKQILKIKFVLLAFQSII